MHNAHGEEWHQEQHGIAEQAEQPVFRRGDIRRVRKYEQQQKRNRFGKKLLNVYMPTDRKEDVEICASVGLVQTSNRKRNNYFFNPFTTAAR